MDSKYKNEWINVDDFLPPFHKRVLLYMPDVENTYPINVGYLETDGNFYYNEIPENIDALEIELVTHWMPLPPTPKDVLHGTLLNVIL
jgi:hypothetical protein